MPLVDGDRPADGDVWFRVLTSSGYITRGRVHHSAFKGNFMGPPEPGRDWDAEASGRLRSLTGSKQETHQNALDYCKKHNNNFHGYMLPDPDKPNIEGKVLEGLTLGVRYTPINGGDTAHADLTFSGPIPADKSEEQKKLCLALPDLFVAIHDSQWTLLPDATVAAPDPPAPEQTLPDSLQLRPTSLLTHFKRLRDLILGK
jgi:hypothetical protein